jgi:polyribonucleotide nucleotidyltransferase
MRLIFLFSSAFLCQGFLNRPSSRINSIHRVSSASSSSLLASSEFFSVETTQTGPSKGNVHTLTIHKLPGQQENHLNSLNETVIEHPLVIQTGKIGRQAAGAVTLTRGDTYLYATAARDAEPKEGLDFLPLSVEYQERFSSAGLTSGGYNKRDGRPAEHEILTCRLIDRPLRPIIDKGWRHETQLLSWVLSYDGLRSCDHLAITASAAALYLSDVPLTKPVAAAMVGYDKETDTLLLNPTNEQMKTSELKLVVAGTKDAVLMIEGAADFLPEEIMVRAVKFGHESIRVICEAVEELGKAVGVTKNYNTIKPPVEGLQAKVDELMATRVDAAYAAGGTKITQGPVLFGLRDELVVMLEEEFPDEKIAIKDAFKDLLIRRMYGRAKEFGVRCDGRQFEEIRNLDMEAGFLPSVHGSALFTRGDTQTLATATLGGSGMRQKIDNIDGTNIKRFYLQYTFPPSCVGETGRTGAPGRREVGHGNLAERYVNGPRTIGSSLSLYWAVELVTSHLALTPSLLVCSSTNIVPLSLLCHLRKNSHTPSVWNLSSRNLTVPVPWPVCVAAV